jgi:hypothetical protein
MIAKRIFQSLRDAGMKVEEIDAHSLLQAFYRCEEFSPEFRRTCAVEALKFEKPAMSSIESKVETEQRYIVRMPAEVENLAEWWKLYGGDGPGPSGDPAWEKTLKEIEVRATEANEETGNPNLRISLERKGADWYWTLHKDGQSLVVCVPNQAQPSLPNRLRFCTDFSSLPAIERVVVS